MTPTFQKERITPEKAAAYLGSNFADNRKLRQSVVDQYANDMQAGRWIDTGEPIRFDAYGNMVDGQHRLTAICQSGITLDMYVIRGLSDGAHLVIDTGQKRTPADALRIIGIQGYEANRAALAKRIIVHERGAGAALSTTGAVTRTMGGNNTRVSTPEVVEYVQNHPELLPLVEFGMKVYNCQIANILSPSDYAFCAWYLAGIGAQATVESFLNKLASQADIPAGESPLRTLFKRLQNRMGGAEKLREVEAAFKAFGAGHQRYRIPSAVKPAPAVRSQISAAQP